MDNKSLIVLIDLLIKEAVAKIEIPEPERGPRGLRGKDGNDFNIEDHKETLIKFIEQHSNITLTAEQIESLKGVDGKDGKSVKFEDVYTELSLELSEKISAIREDLRLKFSDLTEEEVESLRGKDGRDGKDGIDFDFSAHEENIIKKINDKIDSVREDLKLKFSDLTDEEKAELKGPRGQRGKPGEDFVFEDNVDKIRDILQNYVNEKLPELKLNFSDLSEDDIFLLKGKDGRDGKDGIDFDFEENRIEIQNQICEYIDSVKDSLKLTFADLSEEERESLKLKFSDLTEEDRATLKGPRGQRGKPGIDGENGKDGATWHVGSFPERAMEGDLHLDPLTCDISQWKNGAWDKLGNIRGATGLPGLTGLKGRDGKNGVDGFNGRDGRDAPIIENVRMESFDKEFRLIFEMSDGSEHITNYVDFPATVQQIFNSYVAAKVGGGGTNTPATEYFDDGVSLGEFSKIDLGDNIQAEVDGDILRLSSIDTNTTDLNVFKDGILIGTSDQLDFSGDEFIVEDLAGRIVVTLNPGVVSGNIAIYDEYNLINSAARNINFIGDNVTVRQRVPMAEWPTLSDVEPNLSDYMGDGSSETVDVFIDFNDASRIKDVACVSDVYVGAAVRMDNGVAVNALADSYENANVIGIVDKKNSMNSCEIIFFGRTLPVFTGLNEVEEYYLSDTVPGAIVTTTPSIPGHVRLKLGQPYSDKIFVFIKGERVVRG